jgi:hypothetical protein
VDVKTFISSPAFMTQNNIIQYSLSKMSARLKLMSIHWQKGIASNTNGRAYTEGVWEQGFKENIWT